jgi:anaerobic ribonucleoside-triphosphate reductase activating protein
MSEAALNVSATLHSSHANGPGVRAVIWVQGCSLGCPGCYNPGTHEHSPRHIVPAEDLADWISSLEGIEGITFSGGEPFEQARGVSEIIRLARAKRPELSVFIFTGYDMDELHSSSDEGVARLLGMADMLSSGRYVAASRDSSLLWRGSSNQELVYLTNRYSLDMESHWEEESPIEEVHVLSDTVFRTGFLGKRGKLARALDAEIEGDA